MLPQELFDAHQRAACTVFRRLGQRCHRLGSGTVRTVDRVGGASAWLIFIGEVNESGQFLRVGSGHGDRTRPDPTCDIVEPSDPTWRDPTRDIPNTYCPDWTRLYQRGFEISRPDVRAGS